MAEFLIFILAGLAIYIIVTLSYQLSVGYTGLLNFGQVALWGIGAYAAAILTTAGYGYFLSFAAAMIAGGLGGFLLALPAGKIRGDYFALMTLGFTFIVNAVLLNWIGLTRGPFGIVGIIRPAFAVPNFSFLVFVVVILGFVSLFVHRLLHSPFGQALEAVRDDELLAESLGKPSARLKIVSLTTSGVLAGLAGALLAYFIQFINPSTFWLDILVFLLAGLVIGGLASFWGTFVGMGVTFLFFEGLKFVPLPIGTLGPLRLIIFSLLLLLVVLFRPKGLLGRAQLD